MLSALRARTGKGKVMILEEFDENKEAVINPSDINERVGEMPRILVGCYSRATFDRMVGELCVRKISETSCANGVTPIYKTNLRGTDIALTMVDVGAPMSAAMLEDVYEQGVQTAIIFGTCGVLDSKIDDCSVIIPTSAVRDEGTSYHYAPPSDEIGVNEEYADVLCALLDRLKVKYTVGKVWTTDAFYRETAEKTKRRKESGCICVDMECSANSAVAKFRGKGLCQFFYAADNLDSEEWDARSLANDMRLEEKDRIAATALELAVLIDKM